MGVLYLNETCKAYATRDILIPHKIETDTELVDFVPNSQIKEIEDRYASLTTNILENKHVRTNQMFDLNLVAKSTSEIKEMVINDVKTEQMRNSKRRHDYLLYVMSAITIICIVLTIIRCMEQKPWCTINSTMRSRQNIVPDPEIELWHFQTPVQTEESHQTETNDDVPATIHTQNQIKDDIIPLPSAPQIKTRYSVYPTPM